MQKTAYEMRISDWSSDVCSSDLVILPCHGFQQQGQAVDGVGPGEAGALRQLLIGDCRASGGAVEQRLAQRRHQALVVGGRVDRKSVVSGKSVSVRVDLGGRRLIKKTNLKQNSTASNKQKYIH